MGKIDKTQREKIMKGFSFIIVCMICVFLTTVTEMVYVVHNLSSVWPCTDMDIDKPSAPIMTALFKNNRKKAIITKEEHQWCTAITQSFIDNPSSYGMHYSGKAYFTSSFANDEFINETYSVTHSFTSQYRQDFLLYASMFTHMQSKGSYMDLAANHYKQISNTFFLDACLGWNGFCIEAERMFWPNITKYRSCELVPDCVWSEPIELVFEGTKKEQIWGGALAGIAGYNKLRERKFEIAKQIRMNCTTLQKIFDEHDISHIDYLSLDIEGAELHALKGIDWKKNPKGFDVITLESNDEESVLFLEDKGYVKKLETFYDVILVHREAADKMKWIDDWIQNAEWKGVIDNLSVYA